MHMSDALLSVAVGGTMSVVSTGTIGYSIRKIKKIELEDSKIPMMGVMGAFIFAAQMINFTIPVTGSSGHIGGGILLAALLGPYPALITLASVLLIQCLLFADGGLLALGCNIFNIAVIPCLIAYPLIYKPFLKTKLTPKRITIAAIISVVVGLQLGAFSVVLETLLSGITELPFTPFVALMQPIHLAIGIVEGMVTAAVLCFIYSLRKDILENALGKVTHVTTVNEKGTYDITAKDKIVQDIATQDKLHRGNSMKKVTIILAVATVFIGGVLSWYASSHPDGLEWAILKVADISELSTDSEVHSTAEKIQNTTAILPDYALKEGGKVADKAETSLSGIVGGLFSLLVASFAGIAIIGYKKIKQSLALKKKET